ncbi:MAG: hypothetical protein HPY76_14290, partial [Anaerolineae bacterium]|nr:hypothetical protein [Anaerolineae bacterium]
VGYAWVAAVIGSLLVWFSLIVARFQPPFSYIQPAWQPADNTEILIAFQLDSFSWAYVFALASILVAYLLTSSARLHKGVTPDAWAGSIALVAAGIIACLSATPLALAATWTMIDLIELAIFLANLREDRDIRNLVASFSFRLMGTVFLLWALIVTRGAGEILVFGAVIPQAGIYLLIAAGLRLGVIPLYLPHGQDSPARSEFGTIIRMTVSASGLAYLGRFPSIVVSPGWSVFILVFTTLALLYGSIMWLTARDEIAGRPFWMIALASMAISSVVRGNAQSSITWGVLLLLCGSTLFFATERTRMFRWINLLSVASLLGLPFTPAAAGWLGLIVLPFNLMDIVVILAYTILLVGTIRHALRLEVSPEGLEPWVQAVYPIGLIFLIISQWLVAVFGVIPLTIGVWYAAAAANLLALVAVIMLSRRNLLLASQDGQSEDLPALPGRVGVTITEFVRLEWLYAFLARLYRLLRAIVNFITRILEGDGGLLWVILMLALVATFLRGRGV